MVFEDNMSALRSSAIVGVYAAVVFILGILATKWEEVSDSRALPLRHHPGPYPRAMIALAAAMVAVLIDLVFRFSAYRDRSWLTLLKIISR